MMTKRLICQYLLSLFLAIGVCGVCFVVGGSIVEALPSPGGDSGYSESIGFSEDGTPVLMRQLEDSGQFEYRDLQRNLVSRPQETHWLRQAALQHNWANLNLLGCQRLSDGLAPTTYWYPIEDEQRSPARAYFVGYDSRSRNCIGYLGLAGFREDIPPREEMFPGIRRESDGGFCFLYNSSAVSETVAAHSLGMAA